MHSHCNVLTLIIFHPKGRINPWKTKKNMSKFSLKVFALTKEALNENLIYESVPLGIL